jgi:hypothetical protein
MTPDQKSLTIGIIVGVLISLTVFAGGILVWIQLSSTELKVPANQLTSITVEGKTFNFIYHPDSGKLTVDGYDYPSNVGFVGSWSWGRYTITEVNSHYAVLIFKPWRFSSLQDVTVR